MSTVLAPPPPPGERVAPRSVFILDDDPQIGMLIAKVVATCGLTPRQFTAPAPFFKQLDDEFPGLIVLDLALGQSDAVEIIRRLEPLKFRGCILLISGRDEATLAEIAAIGAHRGLTMLPPLRKPFRASDIRARLADLPLDAPQQVDEIRAQPHKPRRTVQLTEALRRNWLELWYQPKIDLKTLQVCGAEGLMRARHPELGVILPESILPPPGDPAYAPLTKFVIGRAVMDWTRFAGKGLPLRLAINAPVAVITSPDFVSLVRRVLPNDTEFPGLIVEVTEDEVIRDPHWMREIATQLKLYNVSLSIDDFGSAYASLSRLKELHVPELKIDGSFVAGCSTDQSHRLLCQTVIDLAHGFGAAVCAEGVETAADLRALMDMGADQAQGFLFAEPMPAERLTQKLLAGHGRYARP